MKRRNLTIVSALRFDKLLKEAIIGLVTFIQKLH
jgi:hypothetical protein